MAKYCLLLCLFLTFLSGSSQQEIKTEYINFKSSPFTFTLEKQGEEETCSITKIDVKKDTVPLS